MRVRACTTENRRFGPTKHPQLLLGDPLSRGFGFLPVLGTLFGSMCLSAILVISIVVIVSVPSHVGINCWHRQSRLPAILLFPLFWHPHTWGWIADTQQIDSVSCPFDSAMSVRRRDV